MVLYFISLGLNDEKDMSIKALETAKSCDLLFAEFYTTKLNTTREKLEEIIGKSIKILSRQEVEESFQEILNEAKTKKVGFLVGGDCFVATTHISLRMEAIKQGIETKVIHGSSIVSAIAETGLHIYKFGPLVTIPFPEKTKNKLPESVYETIKMNKIRGLHTLCLLDINVEENKIMSVREALEILLKLEEFRGEGVITPKERIVVLSRAGSEEAEIFFKEVKNLMKEEIKLPAVLIILGPLHFTEKDFLTMASSFLPD